MNKVVSLHERRKNSSRWQPVRVRKQVQYKSTFDYAMIVTLVLLVCFGLVMVFSASYYMAETKEQGAEYYFVKQLVCVGIGAILTLFFMFFDYKNYLRFPVEKHPWMKPLEKIRPYWIILVLGLISLALVYSPIGVNINGSRRWINVGISIQPSEIMKMALIIFLACSIGKDPRRVKQFKGLFPYLMLLLMVCAIIYFQPNFSAIICIVALVLSLLMVGGARLPHLGIIVAVGLAAVLLLVAKESYRADRLEALADPSSNWQLKQSLYSIGSGGFFGRGLGNSMQKLLYLPYRESDFIFAIIAEELGFVGCLAVLALFGILIWRGVVVAMRAPDLTGMLLATGAVAMIAIQVIVNIGVNVGLIPPTGVVLPFISYGGSGVIIFMSMVGIMLNVSRHCAPVVPVKETGEVRVRRRDESAGEEPEAPRRRKNREAGTEKTPIAFAEEAERRRRERQEREQRRT